MRDILKFSIIFIALISNGCASALLSKEERLLRTGQYSEIEKSKESELENSLSPKSIDIATLCNSNSKTKRYAMLFSCLERLEGNINKGDKTGCREFDKAMGTMTTFPCDISALPNLLRAEAFVELGDYSGAVKSAQKALNIISETKWSSSDEMINWPRLYKIRSLGLIALSHALNQDRVNAFKYLKDLEEANVGFIGMIPIKKAKNMALARTYMALGEYNKILSLGEGFLDFVAASLQVILVSADDLFLFVNLPRDFMLNKALFETGNIAGAKSGYDRLLKNNTTKQNGELYWPILFDRGRIYQKEGFAKEAIENYKKSIDVIEAQRSTINTEASKIGFVGDKQKVYHQMISALFSDGQYTGAFEYVERSKSRALVDLLASKNDFAVQNDREKTVSTLKEIEAIEFENKALDVAGLSADKIIQRNTRSIEIKEKIKTTAPELSSLITVSAPSYSEIQSDIRSDETLIEFYYHGEDLYVFVLTKNELKAVKLDGKNFATDVEKFRKSLEDSKSKQYPELSQKLYQRLIKPIENQINTQKLIIVPHGVLHYLPFNALNNGKEYLIDRYSVGYLPSSGILKFLKLRPAQKTQQALIFGNPDLNDQRYELKYAEEEAVAVSKILPQAKVFLRKDATETAFKNSANQFSHIHFATHGMFESGSPLNSGLFLAKDSENDGLLSVNELYSLRLNAELVTLSACETGLGKVKHGDDVVGLTRGFLYAGANSIVASLWKVDDLATSQLMAEFYSNVKTTNKREALRQAQLYAKKQYEHPFFWAAFQLTGITE